MAIEIGNVSFTIFPTKKFEKLISVVVKNLLIWFPIIFIIRETTKKNS